MRLLNIETLELTHFVSDKPAYAILSHTWGDEEVTFSDLSLPKRKTKKKKGFAKIQGCCRRARIDGLRWVWIDTCCIDKTSSAELSEAINSMYAWYRDSRICYALLQDMPPAGADFPIDEFRNARWFTRGWCLQELIAPHSVEFYAADWSELGTKFSLCDQIEEITAIPKSVLLNEEMLSWRSVAQRMSWASKRRTTRKEDEAYCLLGIFDVNMPLLYGEGEKAFSRLQEEIIKRSEDCSFLIWTMSGLGLYQGSQFSALANSPSCFDRRGPEAYHRGREPERLDYGEISPSHKSLIHGTARQQPSPPQASSQSWNPPQITSHGLRVWLPVGWVTPPGYEVPIYLLWTGYEYRCQYVCIQLEEGYTSKATGGPDPYIRKPPSIRLVYLVDSTQLDDHFVISETYLGLKSEIIYTLASTELILPAFRRPRFDVVLSSSQDTTITFAGSIPKYDFGNSSWDNKTILSAGGLDQIWRLLDREPLDRAQSDRRNWITIMVDVCYKPGRAPRGTTTHSVRIGVSLGWQEGRPICAMEDGGEVTAESSGHPVSDRAKRTLPDGRVVVASYKMIVHETRRSIKTSYTLHVGLAASNCKPGDKGNEFSHISGFMNVRRLGRRLGIF